MGRRERANNDARGVVACKGGKGLVSLIKEM